MSGVIEMCIRDRNAAIYDITGKYPEYIRPPYGCWKCNLDYETKMIEAVSYTHLDVYKRQALRDRGRMRG